MRPNIRIVITRNNNNINIVIWVLMNQIFAQFNILQADNTVSNLEKTYGDKWIAIDKLQHFGYSIFVSLGCQYILVNKLEKKESEAILISSLASFGAGLAKEIQDKKSSYFSKKDMVANFFGISTAFIIVKLP